MRRIIDSSRLSLAVVAVLVGLLAVLATLQYSWIAQLSQAERVRLQEDLDRSAAEYCEDLDREVARAFVVFGLRRPADDGELSRLLDNRLIEWRATAVWPELVKDLTVVRRNDTGEVTVLCFDEQSKDLLACDWDDGLREIRGRLHGSGPRMSVVNGVLPGLVLAVEVGASHAETPGEWRPPRDHLIVRFDLDFIATTILPSLAETHFGLNGGIPYLLSVSSVDGFEETIFQTTSPTTTRTVKPDAKGRLFGLRVFPEFTSPRRGPPRRGAPPPGDRPRNAGPQPDHPPPPEPHARAEEGRWVLSVRHPEGSLEDVVDKARRRNMAISAAMLVMLGVTAVLMVASTRRARRLARQQMDFVAAVSHELRTPLTAIRSAGQNLADGIVGNPKKVQSYGMLIEREGRRLTEMIGRVLTFAGIRSGRQIYRMEPVDVGDIVQAALKDGSWVLEESGFLVETEIAEGLPHVSGDAVALRQVVTNLIDNALKYAADGRWLGVQVGLDNVPNGGNVRITVSDRGPGIPKREIQIIFEPFQRGSGANAGGNPGSGLGLALVRSIVEAHGGSVEVASSPGGGATFNVRLPVASARAAGTGDQ